jgi:succinate dehydrogenase/fumarate reductase flavoprotein subunit
MGGIRVDSSFETRVPRLFAAGEAVGGANGANRLSGNAISEALVFGERAGLAAATRVKDGAARAWRDDAAAPTLSRVAVKGGERSENPAALIANLQKLMADRVGPIRTEEGLAAALAEIIEVRRAFATSPPGVPGCFDTTRLDWFDLRNMLLVAEAVIRTALARRESRGAHQREDFPALDEHWRANQFVRMEASGLVIDKIARPQGATRQAAQ